MVYETMNKKHLPEIQRLQREWFDEDITYGHVAGTIDQIEEMLTEYCLIARNGNAIIGYIMAEVRHGGEFCVFPKGAGNMEITDLYVGKGYRSRGIGRELIRRCEEMARRDGINHFSLSSATKDAEAVRRFYTDNGYAVWTTHFFKETK